jgi:hypothetical protein
MNIWVVRETYLYDNDTYLTTHLTEKGALMQAIDCVREHVQTNYDEDEIKERIEDGTLPRHPDEDLKCYSREQLRRFIQEWWEYSDIMNDTMQYEIHETVVTA